MSENVYTFPLNKLKEYQPCSESDKRAHGAKRHRHLLHPWKDSIIVTQLSLWFPSNITQTDTLLPPRSDGLLSYLLDPAPSRLRSRLVHSRCSGSCTHLH